VDARVPEIGQAERRDSSKERRDRTSQGEANKRTATQETMILTMQKMVPPEAPLQVMMSEKPHCQQQYDD
jgi:hypothetical protein